MSIEFSSYKLQPLYKFDRALDEVNGCDILTEELAQVAETSPSGEVFEELTTYAHTLLAEERSVAISAVVSRQHSSKLKNQKLIVSLMLFRKSWTLGWQIKTSQSL